ncbi:hypothetical protein SETIT_8G169100v2 [Setaria italica]|uniref:Uncharacterized protein n=1 Tax=Setaria italica TaxID=4555 RepID=A0A368S8M4_SETIT|nr:hypothetical protein SETIT_8G169100v2 [Setaria italica]
MATLVSNNKRHPHRTWHGKRERGDKELTMVLLGRWLWSVLGACARQFQLASHHLHRPFLLRARLPRYTHHCSVSLFCSFVTTAMTVYIASSSRNWYAIEHSTAEKLLDFGHIFYVKGGIFQLA